MPKKYKVSRLSASARRPSTRSPKAKHVKRNLTLCMLALVAAIVAIYALVQYVRTDHTDGGVEIVVGSQLMAYVRAEDVASPVSVTEALDAVAVRPTSMQTIILSGPKLQMEFSDAQLDTVYLIGGEKGVTLADEKGTLLGEVERIYIPIDE